MFRSRAARDSLVRWEQILNRPDVGLSHYTPLKFNCDLSSTADADPGGGFFTFNNATQESATFLYFSELETTGHSVASFFGDLPQSGYLYMQESVNTNIFQIWKWTAITSGTGYKRFAVTFLDGSGDIQDDVGVYVEIKPLGTGGGSGEFRGARVWLDGGTIHLPSNSQTVTFLASAEKFDVGGYWADVAGERSKLTVPAGEAGYYLVHAETIIGNNDWVKYMFLRKNGTDIFAQTQFEFVESHNTDTIFQICGGPIYLDVGDYVEWLFGQASASSYYIAPYNNNGPWFAITKVGT